MTKLKFLLFLTLGAMSIASYGGAQLDSPVSIVDQGSGSFDVRGSMASARYSDNDVEYIGCRVGATAGVGSQVLCTASDASGLAVACFSDDPFIVEAAQAMAAYSWFFIRMSGATAGEQGQVGPPGTCDLLFVSNRSFHLPDNGNTKKKKKKKDDDDDD